MQGIVVKGRMRISDRAQRRLSFQLQPPTEQLSRGGGSNPGSHMAMIDSHMFGFCMIHQVADSPSDPCCHSEAWQEVMGI